MSSKDVNNLSDRISAVYVVCGLLFIFSFEKLSDRNTSKRGNYYGIIAMILAIISTLFFDEIKTDYIKFLIPLFAGGIIGILSSAFIKITRLPEYIAFTHSLIGLCNVLLAFTNFLDPIQLPKLDLIIISFDIFIGTITFSGSFVAFLKFMNIGDKPIYILGCGRHILNFLLISGVITLSILFVYNPNINYLIIIASISLLLGFNLIVAISGADMPIVVSIMNSFSGLATSSIGFNKQNNLMIMGGGLLSSSGFFLSYLMCNNMNRSFYKMIVGGEEYFQKVFNRENITSITQVKKASVNDLLIDLEKANDIIIVIGYGLALSRSHFLLADIIQFLIRAWNKNIRICIHPVAGRLPGHMNALLDEAKINYNIVHEMKEINPTFKNCELALVIGANDIVNSSADEDPTSPIFQMPVCRVWEAKKCIIIKRSMSTGYNNVENPIFYKENTKMLFGDAKDVLMDIYSKIDRRDESVNNISVGIEMHKSQIKEDNFLNNQNTKTGDIDNSLLKYLTIGIPKEVFPGEKRVSIVPKIIPKLLAVGFDVVVEEGAGIDAGFSDYDYIRSGAKVVSYQELYEKTDILIKIRPPQIDPIRNYHETQMYSEIKFLISYIYPRTNTDLIERLTKLKQITVIGCDCVPRITKAQSFDTLTSMSNILGYRAVLEAFYNYDGISRSIISSSGKSSPANVLIIGAGVTGLSAIQTAKSLGSNVKAFDSRINTKDQVESLGAEFIKINIIEDSIGEGGWYAKEMSEQYLKEVHRVLESIVPKIDIVICSLTIPGKSSPKIITKKMVKSMHKSSVIVDLSTELGGNCELTIPGQNYIENESGVFIYGSFDILSKTPQTSSFFYSKNMYYLLKEICKINEKEGFKLMMIENSALNLEINLNDDFYKEMVVITYGKYVWIPPENRLKSENDDTKRSEYISKSSNLNSQKKNSSETKLELLLEKENNKQPICTLKNSLDLMIVLAVTLILLLLFIGIVYSTNNFFVLGWFIFVLSFYTGYSVVIKVNSSLNTSLVCLTNTICGIIIIGGIIQLRGPDIDSNNMLSIIIIFFSSINIFGGFYMIQKILNCIHS